MLHFTHRAALGGADAQQRRDSNVCSGPIMIAAIAKVPPMLRLA